MLESRIREAIYIWPSLFNSRALIKTKIKSIHKRIRRLLCYLEGCIILAFILLRNCLRVPDQRIRQYTGYAYCLMGVQLCSTTPEIFLCSGFYSKYSLAGLCNIQIHLHDPLLAPKEFNQDSIIGFKSFTPPTVATEGKAVLGNLLGYSAAAPDLLALLLMFVLHLDKFLDVKAPVLHEAAVLGRHYSTDHNR